MLECPRFACFGLAMAHFKKTCISKNLQTSHTFKQETLGILCAEKNCFKNELEKGVKKCKLVCVKNKNPKVCKKRLCKIQMLKLTLARIDITVSSQTLDRKTLNTTNLRRASYVLCLSCLGFVVSSVCLSRVSVMVPT